jgi:hypothetical protein
VPFVRVPDRELYWNFICAEANSVRYGGNYADLPPRLLDLVTQGRHDELFAADWPIVKAAVIRLRRPLTEKVVELGTGWYEGTLPSASLESVRLLNYAPFVQLAPSRSLGEFVTALDSGKDPAGDEGFGRNYRRFRAEYSPTKVVGRPVLVGPRLAGPYTEIEGLTRLCSIVSKGRAGDSVPTEVPVLLGVCLQFDQWQWR